MILHIVKEDNKEFMIEVQETEHDKENGLFSFVKKNRTNEDVLEREIIQTKEIVVAEIILSERSIDLIVKEW